jgi:hypothetical protein
MTLLDEQGRRMWAFNPVTDPPKVVYAIAWAWAGRPGLLPPGHNLCFAPCPFLEGGYCLDCHAVAYAALEAARKYEAWRNWLVTGQLPQKDVHA